MYNGKVISVVFPAYNEQESILNAIEDFLKTGIVDELIVVDNNSTDQTARLVLKTKALLIKERMQGYGYALSRGLKEARGDLIIMAEPDGTFVADDIFKLLQLADKYEMVLGSRVKMSFAGKKNHLRWSLRIGNEVTARLLSFLYSAPPLTDCGCTLRLIHKNALTKIIDQFTVGGSHFLVEMTILGLKEGISIIEIPIRYRARVGSSKISGSLKGALITWLGMIWLILRYRF